LGVDLNEFSSASITGTFMVKTKNEYKINQIKGLNLVKNFTIREWVSFGNDVGFSGYFNNTIFYTRKAKLQEESKILRY
jgi:hypothetical protein